jgi:hypothetical protein
MPPDRPHPLAAAAATRRSAALQRAEAALREPGAADGPVTFQAIARRAGVSRQWLYEQPELRAEIERLRDARPPAPARPTHERASEASLRQRVETLLAENRRLRHENGELRAELALAHGHRREAEIEQPAASAAARAQAATPRPLRGDGSAPGPSSTAC